MRKGDKQPSLIAVLVLIFGLLLSACGGSTAGQTPTPGTQGVGSSPSPSTTTAASPSASPSGSPAAQETQTGAKCPEKNETLLIYSSLPMTGPSRVQTVSVVNGMKLALQEHGGKAGGYKVEFKALDDATAAAGKWTQEKETENANRAIRDGATVYLGTFNSGAAAISIPILNEAGIPMISPANTAINLTQPGPPDPKLYESLYRNGPRNYFRVVPADNLQGTAAANWAKELGAKKVYVLNDQEVYGLGLAQVFREHAQKIGLEILGFEGIDPQAGSYASLMQKIVDKGADLVYFGGLVETGGTQLVKDLRDIEPDPEKIKFMGPDGILESSFIDGAGDAAEGAYGTVAAAPPDKLTGPGKEFYENYKKTFGSEPEPYAIFGHDAMLAALLAIDKACSKDPKDVLKALNNLGTVNGALGKWSFDKRGDTTLRTYHGYQVKDGKWVWVKQLNAGS